MQAPSGAHGLKLFARHVKGIDRDRSVLRQVGVHLRIDQAPVFCPLSAHAFAGSTENVRQVMAHVALVGDPGKTTGAR